MKNRRIKKKYVQIIMRFTSAASPSLLSYDYTQSTVTKLLLVKRKKTKTAHVKT